MEAASSDMSAASSVDGVSGSDFLNLGMFSSQQQQSQQSQRHGDQQLLVGSSGFGSSSLGLGGSVFNDGASFDLSDFPSLGGSSGAPGSGAPNGISAALRQQHLMQQHGLLAGSNNSSSNKNANNLYRLAMTNNAGVNGTNFSMTTEDFPALQGGGLPMQQQHQQQAPMGSSLLASQRAPSNSNNSAGIYGSSDYADNNSNASDGGLLGGTGLGGLGSLPQQQRSMQQQHQPASSSSRSQQPQQTQHMTAGTAVGSSASTQGGGNALAGDYGLLGLLGIIRMTDADRNALALGSDLTLLGLNLGSTEQIYSTFSSPWSDATVSKDPHFQVREEW
jgi:CCR4-NOT transcription complex subunit 2